MNYKQRIERLERAGTGEQVWGVFSINYYDNEFDRQEAQNRLLADHQRLTHRVFVTEVPGISSSLCEERLFHIF